MMLNLIYYSRSLIWGTSIEPKWENNGNQYLANNVDI